MTEVLQKRKHETFQKTLTDYFNSQENKTNKWEISYSYFSKAVYDNPVANQYVVIVNSFYGNEECYVP